MFFAAVQKESIDDQNSDQDAKLLLEGLIAKGLVEEFTNEMGETRYRLTSDGEQCTAALDAAESSITN